MSRKKKRKENSSSEQGLHLKSTPKGDHVPQYVPRVAAPRFKPRRRYWRPRRRNTFSRKLSDMFLGVLIMASAVIVLTLFKDSTWFSNQSKSNSSFEDRTTGIIQSENDHRQVTQTVQTKKHSGKKHHKTANESTLQTTEEQQTPSVKEDADTSEENNDEKDSGLFDQLFNKAITGAGQTQQSKQPHYQPSNIPKQFVPTASWSPGNLESHWAKHGMEFPEYRNAAEYGNGALYFFERPPPGTLRKFRENGDRLYYHPPTNTFGVTTSNGTPKTMFRPDRGMDYWNRQ